MFTGLHTDTDSRERNACSTRDAQNIYSTKLEAKYGQQQGEKWITYYIHSVEYTQTNQIQHTGSTNWGNQVDRWTPVIRALTTIFHPYEIQKQVKKKQVKISRLLCIHTHTLKWNLSKQKRWDAWFLVVLLVFWWQVLMVLPLLPTPWDYGQVHHAQAGPSAVSRNKTFIPKK